MNVEMEIVEIPNFTEIDDEDVISLISTSSTESHKPKKTQTKKEKQSKEEKKEKMLEYYHENKEEINKLAKIRRKYKAGKLPKVENHCFMRSETIKEHQENGNNKRKVNIDYMIYGGTKRTITINQPTEQLIALLTGYGLVIEDLTGKPDPTYVHS